MAVLVELKPERSLLDPGFESYKLSLESLPVYHHSLETGVDHVQPSDDQYAYQHVRMFSLHNHLHSDPWNPDVVYLVSRDWAVRRANISQQTRRLDSLSDVWEIPAHHPRAAGHYNISLSFADAELAVVSDGAGTLHLVYTGERSTTQQWKVVYSDEVCGPEKSFTILHSTCTMQDGQFLLHCLLLHVDASKNVERYKPEEKDPLFLSVLEWITYIRGKGDMWSVERVRQLAGSGGMEYAVLETGGHSLLLASEKLYRFLSDSARPVNEPEKVEKEETESQPSYLWMQNPEDIQIWFRVPDETVKSDVTVDIKTSYLSVMYREQVLLQGPLWHACEGHCTTWTIEVGRLEVLLIKAETGLMWQELVTGSRTGEEIVDPEVAKQIHERLAHLTSEHLNADPQEDDASVFSNQQLEECDAFPVDTSLLVRLDGDTHEVTHQASLGSHQWLFSVCLGPQHMPAFCLRHDVDGLIWQPEAVITDKNTWRCKHVGTFSAFGYVQASKQQRKFSVCAPDMSYAAICDVSRHVYIYRQPTSVTGDLRNRRTGRHVGKIAKQQVVSLDPPEEVMGVHASSTHLFILTGQTLFAIAVNEEI